MFVSPSGIKVGSYYPVSNHIPGLNRCIRSGNGPEHSFDNADLVLTGIEYWLSDIWCVGALDDQSAVRGYLLHLSQKIHKPIPPLWVLDPIGIVILTYYLKDRLHFIW